MIPTDEGKLLNRRIDDVLLDLGYELVQARARISRLEDMLQNAAKAWQFPPVDVEDADEETD